MKDNTLYLADIDRESFKEGSREVDIVCAGDSITGWNNVGDIANWPFPTYPQFLQELVNPIDLGVANGGRAGAISGMGIESVKEYLKLFPNSKYFIIGFGSNDLALPWDLEKKSRDIIGNIDEMVESVLRSEKKPILINVPYVNDPIESHEDMDYHNQRLNEYCERMKIPLSDICSLLKPEHFGDPLHPNERGARLIARTVHAKIVNPLETINRKL